MSQAHVLLIQIDYIIVHLRNAFQLFRPNLSIN